MAFFKFFNFLKKPDAETRTEFNAAKVQTESVETLRKRARHRLIGATILVFISVLGFPWFFDTQPRPVGADVPILIPNSPQNQSAPSVVAPKLGAVNPNNSGNLNTSNHNDASSNSNQTNLVASNATNTISNHSNQTKNNASINNEANSRARLAASPRTATAATTSSSRTEKLAALSQGGSKPDSKPEQKPKPEPKTTTKPDNKSESKDAKSTNDASSENTRYIVQIGAYAENAKAREVRLRLESAGLKTYTHVANTSEGERIRVRLGPFSNKLEAEKAANKAKSLNLTPSILEL